MQQIILIGVILSILVLLLGYLTERKNRVVQSRLIRYAQPTVTLEDMELRLPLAQRVLFPLGRRIGGTLYRLTPGSQISTVRQNLVMAGQPAG